MTRGRTQTTPTPAPAEAAPAGPPPLAELAKLVGPPNEPLRVALFRRVPESQLVEHGSRIDSQAILDDVPVFVHGSLAVLKRLSAEQRSLLKLPPGLFALLVDEALVLSRLKADHDAMIAAGAQASPEGREAHLRKAMREGIALRNVSYQALRNVLGRDGVRDLEAALAHADAPEALARGLESLADAARKLLAGDSLDRLLAAEFGLDEPFARDLEARASALRTLAEAPPPPDRVVTQRMLDLEDGRVLHLIAVAVRAFRAAHKADEQVATPDLHATAFLFDAKRLARQLAPPAPLPIVMGRGEPQRRFPPETASASRCKLSPPHDGGQGPGQRQARGFLRAALSFAREADPPGCLAGPPVVHEPPRR